MNTQKSGPSGATGGVPSGSRENMTGPHEGRDTENRLHDVDLEARGEFLEDAQRDRDSNGLADGYDDSIARRKGGDTDRYGVSRGD